MIDILNYIHSYTRRHNQPCSIHRLLELSLLVVQNKHDTMCYSDAKLLLSNSEKQRNYKNGRRKEHTLKNYLQKNKGRRKCEKRQKGSHCTCFSDAHLVTICSSVG